jgi:hypothetical protein
VAGSLIGGLVGKKIAESVHPTSGDTSLQEFQSRPRGRDTGGLELRA